MPQTTDQIIETAEEREYAAVSATITALNVAIEQAERERNDFAFRNTIPTTENRTRFATLQDKIDCLQRERQNLLPTFARFKSRVNGWE